MYYNGIFVVAGAFTFALGELPVVRAGPSRVPWIAKLVDDSQTVAPHWCSSKLITNSLTHINRCLATCRQHSE